jgi:putative transposase
MCTYWGSVAVSPVADNRSMTPIQTQLMIDALRKVVKRLHYLIEVMLMRARWYAAYPLSLRHIEEMMAERGVVVDHATVHR